ncbi:hypothetical protein BC827DRAFT_863191 [Russula dissimulans]|nr:hypothetical protein BC827DRAFT_863191 [Russula dissimulans]
MSSLAHPILSALFPRISPSAGWAVRCRRAAISCYPRYYQQSMQKRYAMMLSGSNRSSAASKAESHRHTTNMVAWRRELSVMKTGAGHFRIRRAALEAFERASRAAQADTVATHRTGARMASRRPERELSESESVRRLAIATMFTMGINTRDDNGNIPMPYDVGSSVGAEPGRVLGQSPRQVKRRPDSMDELNEAVDSPSCSRDTDLLMQGLSVTSHGEQESRIPANLGAASVRVSGHVHTLCIDHQQCLNANSTAPCPGSTHERVPTSPHVPLHIVTPPDRLHPTLSSWIKNMNKLSNLIDRLQELASSAPVRHRSQLSRQVVMLRETFKSQQERCVEFLQLSEEYASKYLLDISGELNNKAPSWKRWRNAWTWQKCCVGRPLHCGSRTSPEQLPL